MASEGTAVPRVHDALVIGAGQGGLAASFFLTRFGIEHVVLERSSIASSWREHRWDSFCTVTPNWSIRLPGAGYAGDDPNGFLGRDALVGHFEAWARSFDAPVRCGIEARAVRPAGGGFEVATSEGPFRAATWSSPPARTSTRTFRPSPGGFPTASNSSPRTTTSAPGCCPPGR